MLPVYVEILDVIKNKLILLHLPLFKRNRFYTLQLRNVAARWQKTDRNFSLVTPKSPNLFSSYIFQRLTPN